MRRSNKIVIGVAIVVIASFTLVGASATTYAGSHGLSLTTQGLALYPDYCGNAHYRVTGNYRSAAHWDVDVTVTDPKGRWAGGGYYFKEYDQPTIQDNVYLCSNIDTAGTYRVAVAVEEQNSDYELQAKYSLNGSFTFSRLPKAATRLAVSRSKSGKHSWKITGRLTRAGKPWPGHKVQFQMKLYGFWYKAAPAKTTNKKGIVTWRSTPTSSGAAKVPLRLNSAGNSTTLATHSRTFRVAQR